MERTLGGERLGGGKKMKVQMRNYERSTHDLSRAWRSSMSAGTLVPFLKELALPGDTFDIDLNCQVMTLPTLGPLFGTYQVQLDLFLAPIRLYEAKLHMNMLGIGLKMQDIILPTIQVTGITPRPGLGNVDNLQINSSCILKYLGIAGLGVGVNESNPQEYEDYITRSFNAIPLLAYWDTYKNYYANKMEEIGMMIHKPNVPEDLTIISALWYGAQTSPETLDVTDPYTGTTIEPVSSNMWIIITLDDLTDGVPIEAFEFGGNIGGTSWEPVTILFEDWYYDIPGNKLIGGTYIGPISSQLEIFGIRYNSDIDIKDGPPTIVTFPLENIDNMKIEVLKTSTPIVITPAFPGYAPYSNILESQPDGAEPIKSKFAVQFTQEGLGLRTYKSDLLNNWLNTEFIDGPDGISEVTKVSTVGNSFTIDELNMSKKLYDMLNRIAVSGGSYDDWLDAVYTEDRTRSAETPMYMGGLIQDLIFQEVISTAKTEDTPLGQLAGRGRTGDFHRGGRAIIKVDEPSYIIGIVSIVPNVDYSQGNDWDVNLKTMNDLHKPALDEIGFQDLITEQMAWWDTVSAGAPLEDGVLYYHSAGKQPAWINYMTAVNKVYGTFAEANQQMFMVLARRYEQRVPGTTIDEMLSGSRIQDLTTYVDPSKFNHIFADTRLDAQNFWVQIGMGIEARRKMSAKIIPNL